MVGDYAGFPGCGLLRLHSTYRHDLKIYASDEGRVQMTAAAFAKVHCEMVFSVLKFWYSQVCFVFWSLGEIDSVLEKAIFKE